ncbi:sensor histidine kinase [Streptomyces diacarni]|nr:histidine kinase [Streptomyces diacarni]
MRQDDGGGAGMMTSQVHEEAESARRSIGLVDRLAAVPRRVRGEAVESWAVVRAAPRRTVVIDVLLSLLAAAFGLVPLLLAPPERPVWAVLEALWTALLVLARRGRPDAAIVGVSLLVVGDNVWTVATAPLLVLSATRRLARPRRAWQAVGVACAVVGVLTLGARVARPGLLLSGFAQNSVSAALLLLLPALAGVLLGRRRPLVSLLRERNAYLEQARALTAAAARMEERNRIAGEMHDLLGHRLSLISVHAGALELAVTRQAPALTERVELLRTTSGTALEELREILGVLRHGEVTDLDVAEPAQDEKGTRADITALVRESRRTGSTVELVWSVPDTAEVGRRTRQAVHRIVREGLTNVLKHASGARTEVVVGATGQGVEVLVTNEAPHEERHSPGGNRSGLAGCQERITLLGGTFAAGALPGGGFRVAAWLPAHGGGPPETAAAVEGLAGPVARDEAAPRSADKAAPCGGIASARGAHAPSPDEILTWPRILGSGCLTLLVTLPTVVFLIVLLAGSIPW